MTRPACLLALLVGCASPTEGSGAGSTGVDTDTDTDTTTGSSTAMLPAMTEPDTDWWETLSGTTQVTTLEPATDGATTDEPAESTGEPEEDWAGLIFEGDVMPGEAATGWAEFLVIEAGEELCLLSFVPAAVASVDTCAECEFAFTMTIEGLDPEIDDACEEYGLDPVALEGTTLTMGHSDGEILMFELEGVWTTIEEGWSEYFDDDTFWEWGAAVEELYP